MDTGLGFLPPAFSPDGERMLVEDREGVSRLHVVAARTGQCLETLPLLSGEMGWVLAVSWTAEGLRVLPSGHSWLTCLAFPPDGRSLVAGGMDGTVAFFHAADGRLSHRVRAPDSSVHRLHFFPDGRRLLAEGLLDSDFPDDGPGQSVAHVWDVDSGELLASRQVGSHPMELSAYGRQLLRVSWRAPAPWVLEVGPTLSCQT